MDSLGASYADGRGVVHDYVQAYMWHTLAASRLTGDEREISVKARDGLVNVMTPDQIAEAQRLASEWDAAHPREAYPPALPLRMDTLTAWP